MSEKTAIEKLRILLPHWVEHNRNHGTEFMQWADGARKEGHVEAAELIAQAASVIKKADVLLEEALEKLGGPVHGHTHHHHH